MNENQGIRNHFSKVFVDSIKGFIGFLFAGIIAFSDSIEEAKSLIESVGLNFKIVLIILCIFIAMYLIVFLFCFLRWRKTYILIDDENLIVHKNFLINKQDTTVRIKSIATVNFQRGISDLIFGTYHLQIDIDSSITADKTDFDLIFKRDVAEKIKERLTKHLNVYDEAGEPEVNSDGSVVTDKATSVAHDSGHAPKLIHKFSTWEVIRHCLLNTSIALIMFIAAVVIAAQFGMISDGEDGVTSGAIIGTLVIIVPLLWSMVAPILNLQNFTIEKFGNRAIISYGFFTRRQYNVPLEKVNAIVVHQPLFSRLFDFYHGELISVGMGDEENSGTPIFCLSTTREEMQRIIKELKPELVVGGLGEGSPNTAYFPICVPYFLFGVIATVVTAILGVWWIGLIVLIAFMLLAVLSLKTKSLAILDDKVIITSGVFRKRTIVVPNSKIQNIDMKTGPLSRRLGLAHGSVTVLASVLYSSHDISYFKKERFDKLFSNLIK